MLTLGFSLVVCWYVGRALAALVLVPLSRVPWWRVRVWASTPPAAGSRLVAVWDRLLTCLLGLGLAGGVAALVAAGLR